MDKPHISLKPQEVFRLLGWPVTNSVLGSMAVVGLFALLSIHYAIENKKPAYKRSTLYYLINFIVYSLYGFFKTVMGSKIKDYFPLLASFFIFILMENWFGLLPGVGSVMLKFESAEGHHFVPILRGGTADLNTTIALALLSVILTNFYSIKILGIKKYINKFYRLKDPMSYFIGSLEVVSEISKVISFAFRLFGNIFAGEVLIAVIAFLIPILAAFPFLILEVFVGFIQSVVFASLTAVFINSAIADHH